jgi:hypothetical protein
VSRYPDYIVIRPAADLPEGFLPEGWDGKWFDRSEIPAGRAGGPVIGGPNRVSSAVAVPTDRLEFREDGAVAQVWEVRP